MPGWNFFISEINESDFLIDCRNLSAFQEGTLKGACYVPFIKKAFGSDLDSRKKVSGHLNAVVEAFEASGKERIVVFDEAMGMYASRMLLFLRGLGIRESFMYEGRWPVAGDTEPGVCMLEGGPAKKERPVSNVVDRAFMEKNLTRVQIFDARTPQEYEGKLPRVTSPEPGSLCGRLPGSYLWDWRTLYSQQGEVIDKQLFRRRLAAFPFMPERATVIYDYNGARSCLLALMLIETGFQEVYTYQGSWFEWRKTNGPKQNVTKFKG